jgi:hypothetical protein
LFSVAALCLAMAISSLIDGVPGRAVFALLFGALPGWLAVQAVRNYLHPPDTRENVVAKPAADASSASGPAGPVYRSAVRRAPDLLAAYGDALPTLPLPQLDRRPGRELGVRLSKTGGQGWALVLVGLFAMVWNACGWSAAIGGGEQGPGSSPLVWLFPASGALLLLITFLQFGAWLGARRAPVVELSREPLSPGDEFDVFVWQSGPVFVRSYRLRLICVERVTYRSGKSSTTEERVVYDRPLFEQDLFTVPRFVGWKRTSGAAIPEQAMHSFEASNNTVEWRLVVNAVLDGWPDFEQSYALRVLPLPPGWAAR